MPIPAGLKKVPGTDRQLKNGATAAYFTKPDGTRVFRIYKSSAAIARQATLARQNPRKITKAEAQAAFDRHYNRTTRKRRGPVGADGRRAPRYASPTGRRSARTYDMNHTSRVVDNALYLNSPWRYDFQGVDTGAKARKPLSAAQKAALAKGRAALAAKRRAQKGGACSRQHGASAVQLGGYWW